MASRVIPKILYYYWDKKHMTFARYASIYSFCFFNPSWKVILIINDKYKKSSQRWDNKDNLEDEAVGENYFDRLLSIDNLEIVKFKYKFIYNIDKNISHTHTKDLLNWYLLSTTGGFVMDTDVIITRELTEYDEWKESDVCLTVFNGSPQHGYIPVTFMGSKPNNIFFSDIYKRAIINYDPSIYESAGTMNILPSAIYKINRDYKKIVSNMGNIIYPFVTEDTWLHGMNKIHKDNKAFVGDEYAGIHWYGSHIISKENTSKINEDHYGSGALGNAIRSVLNERYA